MAVTLSTSAYMGVGTESNRPNIGPYVDSNGNIYVLSGQTTGDVYFYKSSDGGSNWTQQASWSTGGLYKAINSVQAGDSIWVVVQHNYASGMDTQGGVSVREFGMSSNGTYTDSWGAAALLSSLMNTLGSGVTIAYDSDGQLSGHMNGPPDTIMGTDYTRLWYWYTHSSNSAIGSLEYFSDPFLTANTDHHLVGGPSVADQSGTAFHFGEIQTATTFTRYVTKRNPANTGGSVGGGAWTSLDSSSARIPIGHAALLSAQVRVPILRSTTQISTIELARGTTTGISYSAANTDDINTAQGRSTGGLAVAQFVPTGSSTYLLVWAYSTTFIHDIYMNTYDGSSWGTETLIWDTAGAGDIDYLSVNKVGSVLYMVVRDGNTDLHFESYSLSGDRSVTPAVTAATTTLPAATPVVPLNATVQPAAISASTTLSAATAQAVTNATVTPAVIAAIAGVTAGDAVETSETQQPAVIAATVTIPAAQARVTINGTVASTLPALAQATVATWTDPVDTGVGNSTLQPLTQAAVGTVSGPVFDGSAASTLVPATQAGVGTVADPLYTATATSPLTSITQAAAGSLQREFTATADSTLGPAGQAASGTFVAPVYTGATTQTLPATAQAASATFEPPVYTGSVTQSLPQVEQLASVPFIEILYADSVAANTNGSGMADVLGPGDTSWSTNTGNQSWTTRFTMDDPTMPLLAGQSHMVTIPIRKSASGGGDPTYNVQLWDNGVYVKHLSGASETLTADTLTLQYTFVTEDVSSGANIEIQIQTTAADPILTVSDRAIQIHRVEITAGTERPTSTGTIDQTLQGLSQGAVGAVVDPVDTGIISQSLLQTTQTAAGVVTAPVYTGTAASGLAAVAQDMVATFRQFQFLRPNGDVSNGGWVDELGGSTNIFNSINETSADDLTFIEAGV